MTRLALRITLAAWVLLVALAFSAAPHSCEWGLSAYTGAGALATLGSGALPFFVRSGGSTAQRSLAALGLVVATLGVWLGGLFLANVQIMCRLF